MHATMSTPMEFIRCGSSSPTSFICKCIIDFLHLLNRSLGQMFSCNSQVFDSKNSVCRLNLGVILRGTWSIFVKDI
jgi:hypothetical protein